ncbi:hypothetical protein MML48_2g00005234 [Holotrichia oblita]|uniref:Uncharacterized protein n=1 Tax=Holotrichia oblita TaxID=644536 RepID=A0ACB9TMR3_HOLOL|nr:hypothetical protein MML48_2g00005234 [Holotrichia oblita]
MDLNLEFDVIEDDVEIIEIIDVGIPRQIYQRVDNFHNLSEWEFFKRFRLQKETVLQVLQEIDNQLEYPYDRNNAVAPIHQLLIALRYYATGSHLLSIADFCGVHISTACRIVKRISRVIAQLSHRYIQMPNTVEAQQRSKRLFFEVAAFPNVIGAIDGTHIRIQSPGSTLHNNVID